MKSTRRPIGSGSVPRWPGCLLAAMGVAVGHGPGPLQGQESAVRPAVLVIGIDGVRPDVLAEVDTPAMDSLRRVGRWTDRAVTTRPTVSGPAWSSMLTGVWPGKHGVTSNDFRGHRYARHPDFLTRLEARREQARTFAVADWLPLVTTASGGPLIGDAVDERVVFNGYAMGWDVADEHSIAAAERHLETGQPDAMFVYLGNPDETSHRTGAIGPEYRAAIAAADRQIGRLLHALAQRPSAERESWLVLVSTDHGRRSDGDHGGDTPEERTIFIVAAGKAVTAGVLPDGAAIVDVAATALGHLGLDPGAEGLDGRDLLSASDPVPGRASAGSRD